jgi:hypothetical protein
MQVERRFTEEYERRINQIERDIESRIRKEYEEKFAVVQ